MSVNCENEPIVLVCAADNNYAIPLTVTVRSVLVNLKTTRKLLLFIIDGGINPLNKNKIIKSLRSEQITIQWLQIDETILKNLVVPDRFSIAAYYRLLIPQLLPQQFNKAIYLDSDLVVEGNLEQLWNLEIGDNYVLAVQDMGAPYVSSPNALKNYATLGIPADYKYFNTGVLVINLDQWRTDDTSTKVIKYSEQNREEIRWCDQDGLNVVLADKWGELDPRWNQMGQIYTYSLWRDSLLDEALYNAVVHHPYIIHFSEGAKPWHRACTHPKKKLFFDYADMTAWSGLRFTLPWIRIWKKLVKVWLSRFHLNFKQG